MVRSTNPATQLMQLCQAKFIGAVHDDGICCGYVDTCFNDGGAEQDIATLRYKLPHDRFQLTFMHLPMRNTNACLGDEGLQSMATILNRFHFIV